MAKRSSYQERAIKNFYSNRESIAMQRLQELATELFLSEGKKRKKQWEYIVTHLQSLGIPQSRIDHLVAQDNAQLLAQLVQELLSKG